MKPAGVNTMAFIRIIVCALMTSLFTSSLHADEILEWPAFEGVELKTVPVAGDVFIIQSPGLGGNVGVLVGSEGASKHTKAPLPPYRCSQIFHVFPGKPNFWQHVGISGYPQPRGFTWC